MWFGLFNQRVVARRPVVLSLTDQPVLRNRPTADSGPVRVAFVSRNTCAATQSAALSGNENKSQLSFYGFWCLVLHKTKTLKMEVGLCFSVFCVCSFKHQETIKQKPIFVFPFLCFLVHKRKNDKTEVIFRFSVFCVCLNINGKTIKWKSNFVFRYLCFFFRKNKKR